jgi:hypothetical protein
MGKGTNIGPGGGRAPSPPTAEAAALEYFHTRASAGVYAPRLPVERWRPEQRKRFEDELDRLERKWEQDHQDRLAQLEAEGS